MRVYQKCSNCGSMISKWTWEQDKFGMIKKYGDSLSLTCKECSLTDTYMCNDFKAKESKVALLIATSIFLFGTPILVILFWDKIWQYKLYGALGLIPIILIPIMIFSLINSNEINRVRYFNRS